jgi:hypothetical protein
MEVGVDQFLVADSRRGYLVRFQATIGRRGLWERTRLSVR